MQPNDMVGLYNADGIRVGTYCESTGRAQIGARFYVPERACHGVSTIRYDYEGGYAGTEYVTELSCGHTFTDSYGNAPNFCCECGAKVVG